MIHSRLFVENSKVRSTVLSPLDGDPAVDRPLVMQFCGNDPDTLLEAARHVVGRCDAVDINLGCPQGIARRGHYGSFLMDEWELVYNLIHKLHTELEIPVTAKIRVFDDWSKSLEYAKMCLRAGAQFLTVHGRTREMKGQSTGIADWKLVRYLRDNLPKNTVFFTNGNILYQDDISRCIEETRCDAVMSAEGNLTNPGIFWSKDDDKERLFPRVDKFVREYFGIVKSCGEGESKRCFKTHLFKSLQTFLPKHTDIREEISKITRKTTWDEMEEVVQMIEKVVEEIYTKDNIEQLDIIKVGELESWGGRYRDVPYWRLQPHFRKVDGVDGREIREKKNEGSKRKAEDIKESETLKKASA
ncbi:DEKNAAC105036 [Brettanomyces naardenensis]|uniref:tRNA-dihydrouridine(16/17) synthase [NAD(P)(+)] n=1 Tax=Brettanomyces naardenensis TaxID=13370 RepID=A0A448YSE6_BRENA|nr:DEKNAAC105036 [Brettanomyces naardenensis]